MSELKDGGPAFPLSAHPEHGYGPAASVNSGMSLRAYAAIKLGVPDSGIDWLDDMIRKSVRDLFAGQALAGLLANPTVREWESAACEQGDPDALAQVCALMAHKQADAMLAERDKGGGK